MLVWSWWVGVGTLLGPEASGQFLVVSCGVILSVLVDAGECVGGLLVCCQVDSGREHQTRESVRGSCVICSVSLCCLLSVCIGKL